MQPALGGALDALQCGINLGNDFLWTWLVYMLLGVGVLFTLGTGFVQLRLLGRSVREMLGSRSDGDDAHGHGITPFQAFVTGLASRVGTGNIAGVAIAISTGGPGAVFWMWMTALLGMSSAFAESSRSFSRCATTATASFAAGRRTTSRMACASAGWARCLRSA